MATKTKSATINVPVEFEGDVQKFFDRAMDNAEYRRAYQADRSAELAELRELKKSGKLDKLLADARTS